MLSPLEMAMQADEQAAIFIKNIEESGDKVFETVDGKNYISTEAIAALTYVSNESMAGCDDLKTTSIKVMYLFSAVAAASKGKTLFESLLGV